MEKEGSARYQHSPISHVVFKSPFSRSSYGLICIFRSLKFHAELNKAGKNFLCTLSTRLSKGLKEQI